MTDTATVEMTVAEAVEQGLVIPATHPEDMRPEDRRFIEHMAATIQQRRFFDEMEAKLRPIQEAHVPFPYGDCAFTDALGHIGNLLMGAAHILGCVAMLPDGTLSAYPEWQQAAVDAAEMKAAAEACYAERQRRQQGS